LTAQRPLIKTHPAIQLNCTGRFRFGEAADSEQGLKIRHSKDFNPEVS
jgi:hypothetical protein